MTAQKWLRLVRRFGVLALILTAVLSLTSLVVAAALAEGAIHPILKRRPSDTAALAYSIAYATGARAAKVHIQGEDGTFLSAWWLVPTHYGDRGVIVCHGVADSAYGALGYTLLFLKRGDAVLVPDSRGHGESGGFNTYGVRESSDAVRWMQWMRAQGVHALFGFGESLGGSILIQSLARGAPLRSLVAECPYSSFRKVAVERVARVVPRPLAAVLVQEAVLYVRLRHDVDLAQAEPVLAIAHTKTPVLLIHGLEDDETRPEHTHALASANKPFAQMWLVPGAHHTGAYATQPEQFKSKVLEWLNFGKE